MNNERVSLKTIAEKAGVSKPVVYTVLNNRYGRGIYVSEKRKEEILNIASELGYVAPKSAKELFTGKSDNIGVILHEINHPFTEMLNWLQREAHKKGFEITPYLTSAKGKLEEHYLNMVRDGRVDGLIAIAATDGSRDRYRKFSNAPYRLKILAYHEPIPDVPTIHFDEERAGRMAAKHLLEAGCKRLAFLGEHGGMPRCRGFSEYIRQKGGEAPLIIKRRAKYKNMFSDGSGMAHQLLKLKKKPDGVFASCDLLAIALLREALKTGIKVPEDMAIMGCDNTEVCLYTTPSISSIDFNIPLLAKKMMGQMEQIINTGIFKPMHLTVPVKLVERESTKRR
ncbi:MAG: LacI family DNA-binding transcriptional regulator [Candidatus Omnitrophica bacterium]|nr:LacI family DNA-binding transcriptional regulator [Candidatus Omnitrophota bacterium]